jgi:hypothetical protein
VRTHYRRTRELVTSRSAGVSNRARDSKASQGVAGSGTTRVPTSLIGWAPRVSDPSEVSSPAGSRRRSSTLADPCASMVRKGSSGSSPELGLHARRLADYAMRPCSSDAHATRSTIETRLPKQGM